MKTFKTLRLLDIMSSLFRAMNIDYPAMRKILQVKLTMDQRRVPTMFQANAGNKQPTGNQFFKSLGIYVLYGLILIPFLFLGNYYFQMSVFFGISMFMLMTSLVSDFSSVLLDVRDKTLLNTKPVNDRTVNAAKFIHVVIYISQLTGALLLIPFFVALFSKGVLFLLLLLVEVILLILFLVALTALMYIYILRFFSAEKLRDIINYVQIIMSVGIIIGYQLVVRMFEFVDMTYVYTFEWWHVLLPPVWFAGPFDLFFQNNQSGVAILMSVLAVLVPLIAFYLYYQLMPAFEENLQKLMSDARPGKQARWDITGFIAKLVCRTKEERMFFRLSSLMMRRERDFKLRVYPSLGMALVFPFIFIMNSSGMQSFSELRQGNAFFYIYFTAFLIGPVVYMLKYSSQYKGVWMIRASSLQNRSRLYSGTLKAFLFHLYFPIFLLVSAVFVWIFSERIIMDLIVVGISIVLQTLIAYKLTNNDTYPFSRPFETVKQSGGTMKTFLMMFFTGIFFIVHLLVSMIDYGIYVYIPLLLIATLISWRLVFRQYKAMIEV